MRTKSLIVFLAGLILAALCHLAHAQTVNVSATLVDGSNNPVPGAYLRFELYNCGPNYPVVSGNSLVMVQRSFDLQQNSSGVISGTVIPNDLVTCGNAVSTQWTVTPMKSGATPLNAAQRYFICSSSASGTPPCAQASPGGTFNPAIAQPAQTAPQPPGYSMVYANPTATQGIDQPNGSEFNFGGTVNFCSATLLCGAGSGGSVFNPGTVPARYTFSVSAGIVMAMNDQTGHVDYSGGDAAVVINQVLAANSAMGGRLFFTNGIYPINSLTQETFNTTVNGITANFSNYYYGIGIPATTGSSTWPQWKFEAESGTPRVFSYTDTGINNNGVIFYVTPTAIATVSGSNNVVGIWQRPSTTTFFSSEISMDGITVRFPTNTRGNELGFGFYAAGSLILKNYLADFNLSYDTIYNGSTPAAGSYGVGTPYGGSSNTSILEAGSSVGSQYCYDFQGEHINATDINAQQCQYAAIFSRSNPNGTYHPNIFRHFVDQENQNGPVLNEQFGTEIDFLNYDIEDAPTGTFVRTNYFYENTPLNTSGIITFSAVLGGSGLFVPTSLFAHGGGNFSVLSGNGWSCCGMGPGAHAFASYPVCGVGAAGRQILVSDSTTQTWGATVTGGGSSYVRAECDGTNYTVVAK